MRKKIMALILVLLISAGLMACGISESEPVDNSAKKEVTTETKEEISAETDGVTEKSKSTEEKENTLEDPKEEVEEKGKKTEEKKPITWYMDEEGLKSDVLGMKINKENAIFEEVGLMENLGVWFGNICEQHVFDCNYYDGDMESYLVENDHMIKDKMGEIEYAYGEEWGIWNVVFVGKGVVISTRVWDDDLGNNQSISDYLSSMNVIKEYDKFDKNCIAYITEDGLYCPELGLAFSCEGSKNVVDSIGVNCSKEDYSAYISIHDESAEGMGTMYYMVDANNAQEIVDKYVEGAIAPNEYKTVEQTEIEGTAEVNLGKYKFLGRGVTTKNDYVSDENWLFYSDDATWSVSVSYAVGGSYENYIAVIEALN